MNSKVGGNVSRIDAIEADLRRLRPGRGIHSPDLMQNLGATLKSVIFGDANPNPSTAQALSLIHISEPTRPY